MLIFCSAGSILSGCSGTTTSRPTTPATSAGLNSVLVTETGLAQKISVISQNSQTLPSGVFLAQTSLQNETESPLKIQAQTFFKNNRGETLDTSPIRILDMEPGGRAFFHTGSAQPGVDRFVVMLSPGADTPEGSPEKPVLLKVK